jgi:tetratricopeptide (TPR) repeat protein
VATAAALAPRRHPWLDRLIDAPEREVRALIEGTADVYPYTRAEPSDAIVSLLYGLPEDDPAVIAFDTGALAVLEAYRRNTPRTKDRKRGRLALCASSLVDAIQRQRPKETVIDLHRRFAYWLRWTETLVYDRGLDLRREFYRTLALTQDIAAAAGLPPRWRLPLWLGMCEEAGERGRFDDSYLTVGLVGLRRLPLGADDSANEEAALHGLARWTARQRPAKPRFLREWHVLEGAFPRDSSYWTALVGRVVGAVEEESGTFPAAAWWREDVGLHPRERPERRSGSTELPPREVHEQLLQAAAKGESFASLEPRLRRHLTRHERYAESTGETFHVVRAACNLGMRLLEAGDQPQRRAAYAVELARLALRFEPANVYGWSLWRNGLVAQGNFATAEMIGWEAIDRFPEDPYQRTQLASLLADHLGRAGEAEAVLVETIRLFPDNTVARAQLAALLADRPGRVGEAETLLRETVRLFPDNVVARTQLADILGRDVKTLGAAIAVLDEVLAIDPENRIARNMRPAMRPRRPLRQFRSRLCRPNPAANWARRSATTSPLPPAPGGRYPDCAPWRTRGANSCSLKSMPCCARTRTSPTPATSPPPPARSNHRSTTPRLRSPSSPPPVTARPPRFAC